MLGYPDKTRIELKSYSVLCAALQERMSTSHGSQCGFCTPGFVMSMYSLLRSSTTAPTEEEIEDALGGNLWWVGSSISQKPLSVRTD